MIETVNKALLPAGLHDTLPPEADFEAQAIAALMRTFESFGYERVQPPLVEFEESLIEGPGQALTAQMFRLMDPVSQRMMGVRSDITPQVARIAVSRLAEAPRPLRLSYGGQVLRVRGSQLRPERQFAQVGAELIGSQALAADAEVIQLAGEGLGRLGVAELSLDLGLPLLVPEVCAGLGMTAESTGRARLALDRKDAAALNELEAAPARALGALLEAAGPAGTCLAALAALELPAPAAAMCEDLAGVVAGVEAALPELRLTIDPVEFRGLEYHSGISFSLFARETRGELGRGGRYRLSNGEAATGFTIFMDTLLRALPENGPAEAVYLPPGCDPNQARALRAEGRRAIQGLEAVADDRAQARRLGCSHILEGGEVVALD
ncbi:MAG TPA: ATP phosphoribosyltransferase regulatory subunit [Alphaproteobacteria bacterium]|jgi:ATP phosphoribosyltransferase regulatory subunit|nr:ATP phosphoribosyltransferase regulatory subunit [Alphaproteobacteria bacterium]MDP6269397.1 ATP phosphoribosyltransferase regulatory subunit [Alphaproteobacteria bacterium]MDP7164007.1 ATP phosphoribosyltransferase regulatory subunit [Alphaproteobacteria bacterium]MDP7428912.1 ATP phosphoribosyltransferase regulatory subunit [Alphaproteobacteria bacterium]HJM50047.1 ATP phosphoribosyltransferase regulatory subunit [Alphaproteobacteria bacterium]